MQNSISVYPSKPYCNQDLRVKFTDGACEFVGTRREALDFFREQNPTKSIIVMYGPKKRV